jgi:hypothetical protein
MINEELGMKEPKKLRVFDITLLLIAPTLCYVALVLMSSFLENLYLVDLHSTVATLIFELARILCSIGGLIFLRKLTPIKLILIGLIYIPLMYLLLLFESLMLAGMVFGEWL